MSAHEHEFQPSPLLAYVNTEWDGPNYRALKLELCVCGMLRLAPSIAERFAGHTTWDSVPAGIAAGSLPAEGEQTP